MRFNARGQRIVRLVSRPRPLSKLSQLYVSKDSEDEAFAELSHLLTEAKNLNKAADIRKVMKCPGQAGCVPSLEEADDATRKLFATYYLTFHSRNLTFYFGPEIDETDILNKTVRTSGR